ncbi:unnamed protein product [Parnassius apollo]|uniref:(apollo) hypothetical protein n=1 Tax=Parnassius apollo TaxID=110799 RepID=A0A8S3WMW2_PARAO|nr:unnamed protein product [Parnassius apollo]
MFLVFLRYSLQMAVEGGLNDEEIRLIVNQESSDEEDLVFRGPVTEDSDDEPDGVLERFSSYECDWSNK